MRKKNKKRKKIVLISLLIVIFMFTLFYFFINDNNILELNNIKDLTANISNISSFSFVKNNNYNKDLVKEINNDYKKEINNLKETLDLNMLNSDKKLINSTVIKRSTNYWYDIITIDKGKKDKIKKGYAVINSNGLVGKIINVNNSTSDVKLLISLDNNNYISAMFNYEGNNYYGLITGYDFKTNELSLKDVIGDFDNNKIIDVNVTTTGLTDSFTSGLLIGKIKNIKKDTFGISNTITITPSVNFNGLNIVTVVVGDK